MKSFIRKFLVPMSAAVALLGAVAGVLLFNPAGSISAKADHVSYRVLPPPSGFIEKDGPDDESPSFPSKPSGGISQGSGGGGSGTGTGSETGSGTGTGSETGTGTGTDNGPSGSFNPGEKDPPHVHSYSLISSTIYDRCDKANVYEYKCSCGDVIWRYGETKQHTWSEETKTTPEDLRTVPCGEMYYVNGKCVVCGYEVNNDVKKEINHEYVYSSLVPGNRFSCTNLYRMNYTCRNCTSSVVMTSDHKEHRYEMCYSTEGLPSVQSDLGSIELKAPSCTESGIGIKKCSRVFEDGSTCNAVDTTQGKPEVYVEDPLGHNMNAISTTQPSCTQPGKEISSCLRCGLRTERVLPANGHEPESRSENGKISLYCKVCNQEIIISNNIVLLIIDAYKGIFETYGPYILSICGSLVGVWGIYLAIRYVTANDTEDKKRVKRMLVNSAIGILILTILIAVAVPVIQIISTLVPSA